MIDHVITTKPGIFEPGIKVMAVRGLLGTFKDIVRYIIVDLIGSLIRDVVGVTALLVWTAVLRRPLQAVTMTMTKRPASTWKCFALTCLALSFAFAFAAISTLTQAVFDETAIFVIVASSFFELFFGLLAVVGVCKSE